ncbi:O-antigen ligase family protein [Desulfovibrio ferrophilus]|uniref:O-antigen polymerase n=1 Tax=Desulfovibrio ferrophilus TaxID=241368 RepID=A0A2Z6B1D9_9BACT|nr:hypothetical protein [Desulfovibrio ferrophilus]BBD09268.1 putative uncharacterized protein [Desulfovibrio ferrophilus]
MKKLPACFYAFVFISVVSLLGYLRLSDLWAIEGVRLGALMGLSVMGLIFLITNQLMLLCLTLAFLPFTRGLFQFEIGPVTFSPFSMGLIVIGMFGVLMVFTGRRKFHFGGFDAALALLCAFYLVSTFLSSDVMDSGFLAFHTLFLPVLSYFCIKLLVDTRDKLDLCFNFFVAGITGFNAVCILQYIILQERVTLLGVPPISIATLSILPVMCLLYSERPKNLLSIVAIAVCLVALFLSFSRIYLLSLLLSPVFMKLIRRGHGFGMFTLMIVFSLGLTLTLPFLGPKVPDSTTNYGRALGLDAEFKRKEKSLGRVTDLGHMVKSLELRALTYRVGLENFLAKPLFGNGMHKGKYMVTQHNFHVEWLEFGGVLGYVAYLSVFICFFRSFGVLSVEHSELAPYVLTVFIILCNSLTNGFMHGFFSYVTYIAFGFAFAARDILSGRERIPAVVPRPSWESTS